MDNKEDRGNKSIQKLVDFRGIENHKGWKTYLAELQKLYDAQVEYMNNIQLSGEQLKSHQLIKQGLLLALNIPKSLELKAKLARKVKK